MHRAPGSTLQKGIIAVHICMEMSGLDGWQAAYVAVLECRLGPWAGLHPCSQRRHGRGSTLQEIGVIMAPGNAGNSLCVQRVAINFGNALQSILRWVCCRDAVALRTPC
jgi:hypothetical protein